MLVSHSFVLARCCFKTGLIDRSSSMKFLIFFDLASFVFCIACDAKLSFVSVKEFVIPVIFKGIIF